MNHVKVRQFRTEKKFLFQLKNKYYSSKRKQFQHERKRTGIDHEHHYDRNETHETRLSTACNETAQPNSCERESKNDDAGKV